MAGSATITPLVGTSRQASLVQRIDVDWTSDASAGTFSVTTPPINGVVEFGFKPGAATPTNAYNITALDDTGVDVLAGQGTGLSNTTATVVCPGVPVKDGTTTSTIPRFVAGVLTIAGSGCGNSKTGKVVIYVK